MGVYNIDGKVGRGRIGVFGGGVLLGTSGVSLPAHGVTQVNNIYGVVGFGNLVRTNGHATVESSDSGSPLFTYAAEADNKSGDLILVIGAPDVPAPPGFNPPTATPTPSSGSATQTPTPTPTTPANIVVSLVATQFQWTFGGTGASGSTLQAKVGQTYQLQVSDGDRPGTVAHGFSGIPSLGLAAQSLTAGGAPRTLTFTPTSGQLGSHFFSCSESSCGSGHDNMLGTIQV